MCVKEMRNLDEIDAYRVEKRCVMFASVKCLKNGVERV